MNIKFRNLFLIGSIIALVILNACKKDDDNTNPSSEETTTPTKPDVTGQTGSFVDSRDGKTYHYIGIGTQFWMTENLAYTGSGQNITDNTDWSNNTDYDAWCYYENNSSNGEIYGVLYQWEVAKAACPAGWHLPTDAEWATLSDYLGGASVAGGKMKEIGTTHWSSPNTGADNSSGFSALPAGDRRHTGDFDHQEASAVWWGATEDDNNRISYYYLSYSSAEIGSYSNKKIFGFSVRCVKD